MNAKKILIILLSILLLNFSSISAEDYKRIILGSTKNIAENPHDTAGSTYYNDPADDFGLSFGLAIGSKKDKKIIETEVFYNTKSTHKLLNDVKAEVTTLAMMTNFFYAPDIGSKSNSYGLIGGGLGFGRTEVTAKYSGGADPGANSQWTLGYQYMIGFGIDNVEIVYKHMDLGTVKSGGSATYTPDKFDNISNSINIRYKF